MPSYRHAVPTELTPYRRVDVEGYYKEKDPDNSKYGSRFLHKWTSDRIDFQMKTTQGTINPGVPLDLCLNPDPTVQSRLRDSLDLADEPLPQRPNKLKVQWPGYPKLNKIVDLVQYRRDNMILPSRRYWTRSSAMMAEDADLDYKTLARVIAEIYNRLFHALELANDDANNSAKSPPQCEDERWKISPDNIQIKHLILTGLRRDIEGIWHAIIYVKEFDV